MKILFCVILTLVCSLVIQPSYELVEMTGVILECPIDTIDFTTTYVEMDEVVMCEVFGSIGSIIIQENELLDEIMNQTDEIVEPLVEEKPLKSVKEQLNELLAKKKAELQEKFKQKFGDKWKDKWKNARDEMLKNWQSWIDVIKELINKE